MTTKTTQAKLLACPYCGAGPNQPCVRVGPGGTTGNRLLRLHPARIAQVPMFEHPGGSKWRRSTSTTSWKKKEEG